MLELYRKPLSARMGPAQRLFAATSLSAKLTTYLAAGLPISYHYDMNLFAAAFYKYLKLGVADLFHRLTLTFYFASLLLALYAFLRRWASSAGAALMPSISTASPIPCVAPDASGAAPPAPAPKR